MMKRGVLCALLFTATACGSSEQAADREPGAGTGDPAATAARSARGNAVAYQELQALLPDLPGWTKGNPQGETVTEDVPISRVQADYNNGESSLSFEIMDTVRDESLLAQARTFTRSGYSDQTSFGYTKAISVRGFPAYEEWTPEARNGAIGVLVADRFTVVVTGSYVQDVTTIQKAVEAINLEKLAGLK